MIRPIFLKLVFALIGLSLSSVWAARAAGRLPLTPSSQLTFYARPQGNFEIYLADTDRAMVVNLTRDRADDIRPAWSPDGAHMAFYSTRGERGGLYLIADDGGPPRLLIESGYGETYPMWSPDGRTIAYSLDHRDGVGVYQIPVDGGQRQRISPFQTALMSYAPDGRRIVFMTDCDNHCDLYVMDADGANARPITRNGIFDVFPVWSPDSRWIAFMSNRDDFFEVYVAAADCPDLPGGCTPNLYRLTDNRAFDGFPVWSPDGTQLLFSSDRSGNFELYTVEVSCIRQPVDCSAATQRLTDQPARDISPSWSPDGRHIAFISGRAVYVMNADGGHIRHLMDDVLPDQFLVWRP